MYINIYIYVYICIHINIYLYVHVLHKYIFIYSSLNTSYFLNLKQYEYLISFRKLIKLDT